MERSLLAWDPDAGQSVFGPGQGPSPRAGSGRRRVLAAAEGTTDAWFLATASGIRADAPGRASQNTGARCRGVSAASAWVGRIRFGGGGPLRGRPFLRSPGKVKPLLNAKFVRVRSHAGALYLLLPEQGAVLKITGLGASAP